MASPSSVFQLCISHFSPIPGVFPQKLANTHLRFSVCQLLCQISLNALLITEFLDNEYKVVSLLPSTTFFQMQAHLQVVLPYFLSAHHSPSTLVLRSTHPTTLCSPCRDLVLNTSLLTLIRILLVSRGVSL